MPTSPRRTIKFNSTYSGDQSYPLLISAGSVYGLEVVYVNGKDNVDLTGYTVVCKIYRYDEDADSISGSISGTGTALFDLEATQAFRGGRWVATATSGADTFIIGKGSLTAREAIDA